MLTVESPGDSTGRAAQSRFADLNDTDVDDVLDDLAEVVLGAGGEVVVVPTDRMPTPTGLAAIYRY